MRVLTAQGMIQADAAIHPAARWLSKKLTLLINSILSKSRLFVLILSNFNFTVGSSQPDSGLYLLLSIRTCLPVPVTATYKCHGDAISSSARP